MGLKSTEEYSNIANAGTPNTQPVKIVTQVTNVKVLIHRVRRLAFQLKNFSVYECVLHAR